MAFAFERLKIVARAERRERAGRTAGRPDRGLPERVGVVLSGGNVGLDRFLELLGNS